MLNNSSDDSRSYYESGFPIHTIIGENHSLDEVKLSIELLPFSIKEKDQNDRTPLNCALVTKGSTDMVRCSERKR